jgi:hypothetical protein
MKTKRQQTNFSITNFNTLQLIVDFSCLDSEAFGRGERRKDVGGENGRWVRGDIPSRDDWGFARRTGREGKETDRGSTAYDNFVIIG